MRPANHRCSGSTLPSSACAVLAVLACGALLPAADEEQQADAAKQWFARRVAEMKEYGISLDVEGTTVSPQLVEQPLLSWSNPLRNAARGALFVWTVEGQPQFVCCAFPAENQTVHEMQSLAEGRILRTHPERGDWSFEPPAAWKTIPDAPKPAANRSRRLVQMRKLAERFTAQVTHPELMDVRQLPQPVYRYPSDAATDGAIFAFVQGTDPECLLLIRASGDDWTSRIARMTSVGLIVRQDDQTLAEFTPSWEDPDPAYRNFYLPAD